MKNMLINGLLKLIPKKTIQRGKNPRILIVSTTGLGDSLWATPALRALRAKWPQGHLSIFTLDSPLFSLYKKLKRKKFDTALIFHHSQRLILPFVWLLGPSKIVGTLGINKGLDHLLTDPLPPSHLHEIERRLLIAGCGREESAMELFLNEKEKETSRSLFPDAPPIIGMHPGSKDGYKQWNPNHFAALGKLFRERDGAQIVVTGNHAEVPLAKQIAERIPGAISIAGKVRIRELAACMERFTLFISNDTGPMHLALAMKTPTVGLFAPTDPELCGPYRTPHGVALKKRRSCSPCLRRKCRSPFCLEQLSPEEVYASVTLPKTP